MAARLTLAALGALMLGYGLWAIWAGRVIVTWGRVAERPDAIYWIAVLCLLLVGGVNLIAAARALWT
jgi:hypothetical protein